MADHLSDSQGAEPQFGRDSKGTIPGAAGLLMLSQVIDEVNYRFTTIARDLRLGISSRAATRQGANADIAALALDSLIRRASDDNSQATQPASEKRGPLQAPLDPGARSRNGDVPQYPESTSSRRNDAPQRDHRDREADRLSRALQQTVGVNSRDNGGRPKSDADLEHEVRLHLRGSGMAEPAIDETVADVARKLRASVEAQVHELPLSRQPADALPQRPAEASAPAPPRADALPTKSEVISNKEFLDRIMVAGFSQPRDERIAEAQLREQEKTNAKLDEIRAWTRKPRKPTPATFARGRL